MVECPTCGREDFASEMGMKSHHKRTHGESIAGITLECERCGEQYREKKSRKDRSKYCSRECREDKVELVCDFCNKEYIVWAYRSDSRFCSRECTGKHKSTITGKEHPLYDGGPTDEYKKKGWTTFSNRYREWVGSCEYCGSDEELHLHHVYPISMGGNWWENKFTVLCRGCHFGNYYMWHPPQLEDYIETVK